MMSKIRSRSSGEDALALMLTAYGVEFEREYRFAPPRRWRADFYLPGPRILVEVQGGIWINGRHNRAGGYEADLERFNAAQLHPNRYRVLQFTTAQCISGEAITTIMEALENGRTDARN
jgi:very-short-patch-repair endonuclease